ncbi:hypothetical protein ACFSHQ_19225 [Gemmobacter lanyuensis]
MGVTVEGSSHDRCCRSAPAHEPVIRAIAMPADTNPSGDVFGGWLMAQMDLAAGNLAARTARAGPRPSRSTA